MTRLLVNYVRVIDSLSIAVGKYLKYGIVMLVSVLLMEAISRTFFNAPRIWTIELATFTLGTYFLISGGYTLLTESHVRMDVLYSKWPLKRRAIFDLATFPLAVIYLVVCILGGIHSTLFSIMTNQHSITLWAPHLAPIKVIITIACVLLLLQVVTSAIRDVFIIRGKPIP